MAARPMRISDHSWSLDVFAMFAIKLKGNFTGFEKHFDQAGRLAGAMG